MPTDTLSKGSLPTRYYDYEHFVYGQFTYQALYLRALCLRTVYIKYIIPTDILPKDSFYLPGIMPTDTRPTVIVPIGYYAYG